MNLNAFAFVVFAIWLASQGATAQQSVPVPVPVADLENSAFKDLWHAVVEEAGINAHYIAMSRGERRDAFTKGTLAMDCCSLPEWRSRPEEQAVQHYTNPIFYTVEHLIVHKDSVKDYSGAIDFSGLKVAMVKGFKHRGQATFGEIIFAPTMSQVYALVAEGEADVTFANNQEFWRRQRLQELPLMLGPVHEQTLLRARVHEKWAPLVPQINAAIQKLRKNGALNLKMGQRLRDPSPQTEY